MCTKGISDWRLVSCLLDTTSFISASICCKNFYFCHKCSSLLYMQIYLYLKRKCLCIKADQHKLPNQLLKLTNQGVDDSPKWMFFLENLKEREIDHWSFICFVVWLGANKIINWMNIAFKLNIFSCWFTLPTYIRGLSTIHPKNDKKSSSNCHPFSASFKHWVGISQKGKRHFCLKEAFAYRLPF